MPLPNQPAPNSQRDAFTFVEILVALSIGAAVLTAGIMAYGSIVVNGPQRTRTDAVNIGSTAFNSFYGIATNYVEVGQSPSYSASAMAESMRAKFYSDVSHSIAVFCLARNDLSGDAARMTDLATATNFGATALADPEGVFLATMNAAQNIFSTNFTTNRSSTYILSPGSATNVNVRAIYETDLITTTDPPGVYASVRRYVGTTLTDYYHVLYPPARAGASNSFLPLAEFHPKASLTSSGTNTVSPPLYFIWWPDPAAIRIEDPPTANTHQDYPGKTSFFFVVPAFPPL